MAEPSQQISGQALVEQLRAAAQRGLGAAQAAQEASQRLAAGRTASMAVAGQAEALTASGPARTP